MHQSQEPVDESGPRLHIAWRSVAALAVSAVAVLSAVLLAAYDKPLDRSSFTPQLLEVSLDQPAAKSPKKPAAQEPPKARPMLLRYDLNGNGAVPWQAVKPGADANVDRPATLL